MLFLPAAEEKLLTLSMRWGGGFGQTGFSSAGFTRRGSAPFHFVAQHRKGQ